MAIVTRWRMPPESWNGYARTRSAGEGMPTCPSSEMAVAFASALSIVVWSLRDSVIWRSIRTTGLSEVIGSWKTMAILAPQMSRRVASGASTISVPSKRMDPDCVVFDRGRSPMIERDRTVLPEPDSPTMPRVSPRPSSSETPSTAVRSPRGVLKVVRRSLTVSRGPERSSACGNASVAVVSLLTAWTPARRRTDGGCRPPG